MKLKATDSFHTSGLGSVHAGQVFEAHDALGKEITKRGLATVVEPSTDTSAGAAATEIAAPKSLPDTGAKMDPVPQNKSEPAPLNKSGPAGDVGPADISKVRKRRAGQTAPAPAGERDLYPENHENPGKAE